MRLTSLFLLLAGLTIPTIAVAQGEVSVERGLQISIIGGCHDCHTEGYSESEGKIDPEKAFTGSSVGWRGPWGTTYATNLRKVAESYSEDGFVRLLKSYRAKPPMPWYNLLALPDSDMRSLYQYIKSLGAPGEWGPSSILNANKEPRTPYIQLAPPQMPKS
jgi:hypothetical protein